jgi:cell division protein FtsB
MTAREKRPRRKSAARDRSRGARSYGTRSAVLGVVFVGLLFTAVYPMQRYFDFRHHIAQLHQQERALTQERQRLEAEKQLLLTPKEIERLAREKLGMVKPGEVPFAIVTPGALAAQAPAAVPAVTTPRGQGLFSRWWNAVSHVFRSAF